jgi:hypothetical protein
MFIYLPFRIISFDSISHNPVFHHSRIHDLIFLFQIISEHVASPLGLPVVFMCLTHQMHRIFCSGKKAAARAAHINRHMLVLNTLFQKINSVFSSSG